MADELILIRHGESLGNLAASAAHLGAAEQINVAHRDPDVPLSPTGVEQARALGPALGALLADGRPTAVWSSP